MELTDNIRYYLSDDSGNDPVLIEEVKNFKEIGGDQYKKDTNYHHFTVEKRSKVTLFEQGYKYLLGKLLKDGPNANIWLITEEKDDMTFEQDWKVTSEVSVDMATLDFNDQSNTLSVEVELVQDNLLKEVKAVFDDEFDVVAEDAPELPYVSVRHTPRGIYRRSELYVEDGTRTSAVVSGGDSLNARAVPWKVKTNSDQENIYESFGDQLNAAGGNYTDINDPEKIFTPFFRRATRDAILKITGSITLKMININPGSFTMDLVYWRDGEEFTYDRKTNLLTMDPLGTTFTKEIDMEVTIKKGETIAIAFLSNTSDGISWEYSDTKLTIKEDSIYPVTYSKAVRPADMFKHLARIATNRPKMEFLSTIFSEGQRHENKLLIHGTWLRNMPQILNEGEEDERRLQAELSLKNLYEAYGILEPLRWDAKRYKGKESFIVGAERDIQQNFVGIKLGETTDKWRLMEPTNKHRNPVSENYYGSIKIGSETSGSNYGEVNNLYSICGYAKWRTLNKKSDTVYERTTEFHTGAEDIEIERQYQWEDFPDIDTERQNDWFLIDCEKVGSEYVAKGWEHYYSTPPKNVYSVETNYNWCFAPVELLRGHGYKISAALDSKPNDYLRTPVGNCNLSLITKRTGEEEIKSNAPFPHLLLEKARVRLMAYDFNISVGQEIVDQLRGQTNGVDNKFGLIEHLWRGELVYSRLIEGVADKRGEFKLIQAKI
ncbi:hypothetical protein [Flagellimonas aurea]|uniref:hypothetical protein n=1 Tax=Flagellimonas aurea TaxID=2915619 RepID=UPI0035D061CF